MDPESYMNEIVDPTIADFETNPTSRRHAFLACVALFHTLDYLEFPKKPAIRRKRLRDERKRLRDESADFASVDRVAHAFKHVASGHPNDPSNAPLRADEVIPRPPAFLGQMVLSLSRLGDATGGVTLNDDREVDVLATLKRAAAFMREKIKVTT
jgi:hypothetical protein